MDILNVILGALGVLMWTYNIDMCLTRDKPVPTWIQGFYAFSWVYFIFTVVIAFMHSFSGG